MKRYIKPSIESLRAECSQIIAVSIIDGGSAGNSEVMTKEDNSWVIWEEYTHKLSTKEVPSLPPYRGKRGDFWFLRNQLGVDLPETIKATMADD